MNRRKLVKEFYSSGFSDADNLKDFLHPEVSVFWNSSTGFHKLDYNGIAETTKQMSEAYANLRTEVSHLLREKDTVTIRFTYFVKTIENPDEELPMAHFIAIWEIKDGKMYKGYQISQLADDNNDNLKSFLP